MSGASKAAGYSIELKGVSKRFGSNVANDKVDLQVRRGTVHAVVGENGAGKSTLMKLAYGQIRADEGEIFLKGERIDTASHSPAEAIERGIGMVHQHFMLVEPLTVVENVVLGRETTNLGLLDLALPSQRLVELSASYGLDVQPDAVIESLSVGEQQRVEIIKVLYQGCDVLILDEPTAVLTPQEVEQLFGVLRGLVAEGVSVVMITHKLDEVLAIADEITVMRAGKVVDRQEGASATQESIAQAMVGRSVLLRVDKTEARPGEVVLDVEELSAPGVNGRQALEKVSFSLKAGEILGIAGVEGNGQRELQECLVGLRGPLAGTIRVKGTSWNDKRIAERYHLGLAHVPEDRLARAVVRDMSVEENLVLGRQADFRKGLFMNTDARAKEAQSAIGEYDIRPPMADIHVGSMSGGNQQKVVIAREMHRPHNALLVCAQPTRGVDIGAIETIHKQIIAARDRGLAVLLFSAELSELEALSDRLLVFYGGRVVMQLDAAELAADGARARIGAAMTGAAQARGAKAHG